MVERIKTVFNDFLNEFQHTPISEADLIQEVIYKLQCIKNEIPAFGASTRTEEEIEAFDIAFHKNTAEDLLKEYAFVEDGGNWLWTRDNGAVVVVFEYGNNDNFFMTLFVRDEEWESGEYSIINPQCVKVFMDNLTIPTLNTYSVTVEGQAYSENEFHTWACEDGIFEAEDSVRKI